MKPTIKQLQERRKLLVHSTYYPEGVRVVHTTSNTHLEQEESTSSTTNETPH